MGVTTTGAAGIALTFTTIADRGLSQPPTVWLT